MLSWFHQVNIETITPLTIEKDEFKLLETVMSSAAKERKQAQDNPEGDDDETAKAKDEGKAFDDDDHGLQRAHKVRCLYMATLNNVPVTFMATLIFNI